MPTIDYNDNANFELQERNESMNKRTKKKEIFRKKLKRNYIDLIARAKNTDEINGIVYHCVYDKNLSLDDITSIQAIGDFVSDYILAKGGNKVWSILINSRAK